MRFTQEQVNDILNIISRDIDNIDSPMIVVIATPDNAIASCSKTMAREDIYRTHASASFVLSKTLLDGDQL